MKLVITADDFGLSQSTNDAIFRGIELGVISSTNVMVNMPFIQDVYEIQNNYNGIFLGIHWNLTSGYPISDSSLIPSLVNHEGKFFEFEEFKRRVYLGKVNKREVALELDAQMNKYIHCFGQPDYWNTHNHIQMLIPLFDVFVKEALKFKVYKMRNNQKIYRGKNTINGIKNFIINRLYKNAKKYNMKMPEGLVSFLGKNGRYDLNSYEINYHGLVELMIHVAYECDSPYFGKMTEERILQSKFYFSQDFIETVKDKIVFKNKDYK